jgi:DNA repair protein RecO (recombination protein O)
LRSYKLGETSKVVVFLTRERGKLRAVAKGARGPRSRYHSALELLSEVRLGLHGREGAELYRLGNCELLRSAFPGGGNQLEPPLALMYFAELVDAFTPDEVPDDASYRLTNAVVRAVEDGTPSHLVARYFEAWLLKLHGLYPPRDRCARCGGALPSTGDLWYDQASHGFVCEACGPASGPVLKAPTGGFLDRLFSGPPAGLSASQVEAGPLEGFHQGLITRHLERELRSYRVLRDVGRSIDA